MLQVYGRPDSSNSAKVFWLFDEIGAPYELVLCGGSHGGNDRSEFRALNPFGKVPVLVDGQVIVWESNAILRYLASRFSATRLWPDTDAGRAAIDRWMDWISISLAPPLTRLRKARKAGLGDVDLTAVLSAFAALDARLAQNSFIAGQRMTLADIAAAPAVHRWGLLEEDKPLLTHLETYRRNLEERDLYRRHISSRLS